VSDIIFWIPTKLVIFSCLLANYGSKLIFAFSKISIFVPKSKTLLFVSELYSLCARFISLVAFLCSSTFFYDFSLSNLISRTLIRFSTRISLFPSNFKDSICYFSFRILSVLFDFSFLYLIFISLSLTVDSVFFIFLIRLNRLSILIRLFQMILLILSHLIII